MLVFDKFVSIYYPFLWIYMENNIPICFFITQKINNTKYSVFFMLIFFIIIIETVFVSPSAPEIGIRI